LPEISRDGRKPIVGVFEDARDEHGLRPLHTGYILDYLACVGVHLFQVARHDLDNTILYAASRLRHKARPVQLGQLGRLTSYYLDPDVRDQALSKGRWVAGSADMDHTLLQQVPNSITHQPLVGRPDPPCDFGMGYAPVLN
jgi:hypothetical protein